MISKLNARNIISAIVSRATAVIRYGAGILNWIENVSEEDCESGKLQTMHGDHHLRINNDRIYMKIANGGRRLINVGALGAYWSRERN